MKAAKYDYIYCCGPNEASPTDFEAIEEKVYKNDRSPWAPCAMWSVVMANRALRLARVALMLNAGGDDWPCVPWSMQTDMVGRNAERLRMEFEWGKDEDDSVTRAVTYLDDYLPIGWRKSLWVDHDLMVE
jgi:hypothetical protein